MQRPQPPRGLNDLFVPGILALSLLLVPGAHRVGADQARQPQRAPASPAACSEDLPGLYSRLAPAVVSIGAMSVNAYDLDHRIDRVSGSGVVVSPDGLILTNSHVVFGRQVINVTLGSGLTLPARFVGADPSFDVALVRVSVPPAVKLPTASLADSSRVRVGEEVYAIGNPLGLEQTLTRGIVSAVNRILPGAAWSLSEPLIQTDAAINPGSSGGPLVNRCGEVIGITTAILPNAQSIAFAVPTTVIADVLPSLIEKGRVVRPWLGVQGQFVAPVLKELLRVPLVDGFLVEAVEPGSPAEKVGISGGQFELTVAEQPLLLGGDIITEVNGIPVGDTTSLAKALTALEVGSSMGLTIRHGGETRQLTVVLGERPQAIPDVLASGQVARLTPMANHTGTGAASRTRTLAF